MGGTFYVDSSALVKLAVREAESPALRQFVAAGADGLVSSELAVTEVGRAARRVGTTAADVVERLTLIDLTPELLAEAIVIGPPSLRTLDALHLATALSLADELDGFVSYDHRLVDAARASGLDVHSPS